VNESADAKTVGVRGLPTVFIGTTGFGGADHDAGELATAIEKSI
jgi:hypothetical protein